MPTEILRTKDGRRYERDVENKAGTEARESKSAVLDSMNKTDLGTKGGSGSGMPQPGPGEDSMSPAYRERVRVWRAEKAAKADVIKGVK